MEGSIREYARRAGSKFRADRVAQGREPSSSGRRYHGVTSRYGNKFGAMIQDPKTKRRVWLGTYDTPEEAACAYDAAVRTMKSNPKFNFPELIRGEEEKSAAAVLAHFAETKRKRKLAEEAVPPPSAPAPAGDVVGLPEPPTNFPGEEDALAALKMLQGQGEASSKNKALEAVVSSLSPAPSSSSAPAAPTSHYASTPVSTAFKYPFFAPTSAGSTSAFRFATPVLTPALLNFMFPTSHAMALPPSFHSEPSPAAPSPPAPAPAVHSVPVFDPAPLAFHYPHWSAPPPGFHLAPAPAAPADKSVVSTAPSSSALAPAPDNASASHFASFFAPTPAPPAAFHLPDTTAPPPGFHLAPAPAAPATTPLTWQLMYQRHLALSSLQAQQSLRTLRPLLSMSPLGAAIMNTSSVSQPYGSSSSGAPEISEAELAGYRSLYRMLEREAAGGGLGDVRIDDPGTQDRSRKKKRRGEA